jgi:hypothetical protein
MTDKKRPPAEKSAPRTLSDRVLSIVCGLGLLIHLGHEVYRVGFPEEDAAREPIRLPGQRGPVD